MKAATKRRKDGDPDQRFARRDVKLAKLETLLRRPRPVEELAEALGCTPRLIYMLLEEMGARGKPVARIGPKAEGRFFLASGV